MSSAHMQLLVPYPWQSGSSSSSSSSLATVWRCTPSFKTCTPAQSQSGYQVSFLHGLVAVAMLRPLAGRFRSTRCKNRLISRATLAKATNKLCDVQDSDLVKYTADDAKKRAPAWAKAAGRSLKEQRARWQQPDAQPGYEYAWRGTTALPATKNLSALLTLDLMEAPDVDAAVRRVLPALSDELYVILVHCIHEMKQTFIKGRPSSGRAFRVDANMESAATYQSVLKSWNSQRPSLPCEATQRVALFFCDMADSIARPLTKKYSRSSNSVKEALRCGALEQTDLPVLHKLAAATKADIQAPPCSKFQSLRLALTHIQECEAQLHVAV